MHRTYAKKRYISYILIFCIVFILPFIRINDNHFFLLSFDHKKLNLFFVNFDTQELYLMPIILIGLFLTIFLVTNLFGRIWCSFACPQTIFRVIFRDLIQTKLFKINKTIKNKQKKSDKTFKKILSIILFYFIALLATSNLLWYFIPPEDFFSYIQNPNEHGLLIGILIVVSLFFTFDIVFLQEKFCIYVCPYARIQSVMFDFNTLQVIYDEQRGGKIYEGHNKLYKKPPNGECIGCECCVDICPTHIDIRKGMQLECINCLECADICAKVQSRFDRPSLIQWTSSNFINTKQKIKYLRPKTIAYALVLFFVFIILVIMSFKKENMLLNINRSNQLYSIKFDENNNPQISNNYIFLFKNTDNKAHEYYFEVEIIGEKDAIAILKPKKSFNIEAFKNEKIIVNLIATKDLSKDNKDKYYDIKIKAYAIDDKNIMVERQSTFIYPKKEKINAKR